MANGSTFAPPPAGTRSASLDLILHAANDTHPEYRATLRRGGHGAALAHGGLADHAAGDGPVHGQPARCRLRHTQDRPDPVPQAARPAGVGPGGIAARLARRECAAVPDRDAARLAKGGRATGSPVLLRAD